MVKNGGKAVAEALRSEGVDHVFGLIGLWGAGAGVVMLALSPWLKKWMHPHEG